MFEDTFDMMEKAFASMRREMKQIFTRSGIRMQCGTTEVVVSREGDISIKGTVKTLKINGKLVRFKNDA